MVFKKTKIANRQKSSKMVLRYFCAIYVSSQLEYDHNSPSSRFYISPATPRPPQRTMKTSSFCCFLLLVGQQMLCYFVCYPDISNICWKCCAKVLQLLLFSTVLKNIHTINKKVMYKNVVFIQYSWWHFLEKKTEASFK